MPNPNVPGRLLDGLVIPPNWEFAYGYPRERREQGHRFIAVWWTPYGDEAMVADGRVTATAEWMIFKDLELFLERAGHGEVRLLLGFSDAEPTHVLLLGLEERTAWVAPYHEALAWLSEVAPAPEAVLPAPRTEEDWERLWTAIQEAVEQAQAAMEGKAICPACWGLGWVRAEAWPADGYVPCERCDDGLVTVEEGKDVLPMPIKHEISAYPQRDMTIYGLVALVRCARCAGEVSVSAIWSS